jgi:hypothetical protein
LLNFNELEIRTLKLEIRFGAEAFDKHINDHTGTTFFLIMSQAKNKLRVD